MCSSSRVCADGCVTAPAAEEMAEAQRKIDSLQRQILCGTRLRVRGWRCTMLHTLVRCVQVVCVRLCQSLQKRFMCRSTASGT